MYGIYSKYDNYNINVMDNFKIGQLIYRLRNEKHLTQLQSANQMNISDKTISKWERGVSKT